jgi:hypothetical protein
MSDSNVIDLDAKRREKEGNTLNRDAQKSIAATFLVGFLALGIVVNYVLVEKPGNQASSREVASAGSESDNKHWKKWLSERLKEDRGRFIASIGSRPTLAQELSMGYFEGKYRIVMKGAHVEMAEFTDVDNDRPKYIESRPEFISKYGVLFSEDYAQYKLLDQSATESSQIETFALLNKDNKQVGKVKFEMDPFGRLLSLSVQ